MTYEIEFDLFIVLDIEVYEDYLAVYHTLISLVFTFLWLFETIRCKHEWLRLMTLP